MARARRDAAGGISGLVSLIDSDGEAIDADLRHFYPGTTLADLFTGRLTFRQLGALLRNLPGDGTALWRANRRRAGDDTSARAVAPPADWWTPERDLLAGIQDWLAHLFWAKTEDGSKGRNPPDPIVRPGVADRSKSQFGKPRPAAEVLAILRPSRVAGDDDPGSDEPPPDREG